MAERWTYEVRPFHWLWQARQLRNGRLVKSWLTEDEGRARERCALWEAARLSNRVC